MIRNVIFDLGNVLISFKPEEFLKKNNYTREKRMTILSEIFGSKEWLMLDNGDISTPEAINGIAARSSLSMPEIVRIFDTRHQILYPLTPNIKMLPGLKKAGFQLYYLSNFPADLWEKVRGRDGSDYDFFRHFDGGIISAEANASKPDIKIYRLLLEKYSLKPEECFYIDDIEANVKSAEAAGMKAMVTFGSTEIEGSILKALGIES